MERKAAVAGGFYPSNPAKLKEMVNGFIDDAPDSLEKDLKGVIVPHAGYIYSGPVAGYAYKLIKNTFSGVRSKVTVFMLGPAHFIPTTASLGAYEAFITPLGKVKVNLDICEKFRETGIFDQSSQPHLPEHSLEVQLPFLQETLKDIEIVPILLGNADPETLAGRLQPYFGMENTLFVISSDLSHYLPYDRAVIKDRKSIDIITGLKTEDFDSLDACGAAGIATAVLMSKKAGSHINLLDYRNSGDTAGEKDAVVGYAALSIT